MRRRAGAAVCFVSIKKQTAAPVKKTNDKTKTNEKIIWKINLDLLHVLLIVKKIVVPVQKIHVREHAQQGGTHVCHVQVE